MKLASIERISEIRPHPNADALEIARVKGWNVVVKKGEFKEGMPCVYVQLDAVLPEKPEFEFLRPHKFRIRPIKLRKVMSQGIVFPLSILPAVSEDAILSIYEGQDVTQILSVTKFEKPAPIGGEQEGLFPIHLVSKTDEERLQNIPEILKDLDGKKVSATIKHDGTSATYIRTLDKFYACSRNWEIKRGDNVYWRMVSKYNLDRIPIGLAVQGEIVGPKIQKNPEGLSETKFRVFNIVHLSTGRIYDSDFIRNFCEVYGLDKVKDVSLDGVEMEIEALENFASKQTYDNGKQAEGIVVRGHSVSNPPISFKVVNAEYASKE